MVDPDTRQVEQYVRVEGEERFTLRGKFHEEIVAEIVPGVRVELAGVWGGGKGHLERGCFKTSPGFGRCEVRRAS